MRIRIGTIHTVWSDMPYSTTLHFSFLLFKCCYVFGLSFECQGLYCYIQCSPYFRRSESRLCFVIFDFTDYVMWSVSVESMYREYGVPLKGEGDAVIPNRVQILHIDSFRVISFVSNHTND